MVVYFVCFDLHAEQQDQLNQIFYWLEFLNSSVSTPAQTHRAQTRNLRVMVIGLKEDIQNTSSIERRSLPGWQSRWANLPLGEELFKVRSLDPLSQSVSSLVEALTKACAQIFAQHAVRIPASYPTLLRSLKSCATSSNSSLIFSLEQLYEKVGSECKMERTAFKQALHYLHSIGQIVYLHSGKVCAVPTVVPKLLAKFVSPKDVHESLLSEDCEADVSILSQDQIGYVLEVNANSKRFFIMLTHISLLTLRRLKDEIELLLELKICFKIEGEGKLEYLFPSLGKGKQFE